jgi:CubicO group peptidase (beta-lactamase class C family)
VKRLFLILNFTTTLKIHSTVATMNLKYGLLSFLVTVSITCAGAQNTDFTNRWDSVIAVHKASLQRVNIVGNGIAITRRGEVIHQMMYGYQDKERVEPITINTVYNWASCTKMFTAIAIMQLRDRKMLGLDDLVSKYVPEIKNIPNAFNQDISIRHVLSQSSGLPRFSRTTKLIDGNFYETQSWDAFFEGFKTTKLQFAAGTAYGYSNIGFDILGLVIERVSGETYKGYVTTHILKNLQMEKSYFDALPEGLEKFRSNNYRGHKKKLYSKAKDFDDINSKGIDYPSGGLNAPFTDMILFLNFLCGADSTSTSVLKYASLKEMFATQRLIHAKEKDGTGHDHFIGLGFNVINPSAYRLVGHEGQLSGFMTSLWINPETDTGYLFAWNTTYRAPNQKDDALFANFNHTVYEKILPWLDKGAGYANP